MDCRNNIFAEKNVIINDTQILILGAIKEITEGNTKVNNKSLILYFIDKLQIERDVVKQHLFRMALEEVVFMTADDI
ncbi:hypothetical protein GP924_21080 [Enterobacteriaceae bacterium 8376wB9]|nr:hypothetical protein [Enterobacteriaceae bacterium 8376wB9]